MSESQVKMEDGVQDEVIQMQQKLQEVQLQKEQVTRELSQVRQEQALRAKLYANGVLDEEAAILVVMSRLAQNDKADVDAVLGQLRKDKPYLFEAVSAPAFSSTRGTKEKVNALAQKVMAAAAKAYKTAGRAELMEYMKARRTR